MPQFSSQNRNRRSIAEAFTDWLSVRPWAIAGLVSASLIAALLFGYLVSCSLEFVLYYLKVSS